MTFNFDAFMFVMFYLKEDKRGPSKANGYVKPRDAHAAGAEIFTHVKEHQAVTHREFRVKCVEVTWLVLGKAPD